MHDSKRLNLNDSGHAYDSGSVDETWRCGVVDGPTFVDVLTRVVAAVVVGVAALTYQHRPRY